MEPAGMEYDVLSFDGSSKKPGLTFRSSKLYESAGQSYESGGEGSDSSEERYYNFKRGESMAATRLLQKAKRKDFTESSPPLKKAKWSSDTESPSLSPSPSPPRPVLSSYVRNDKSARLLERANDVLNQLLSSKQTFTAARPEEDLLLPSITPPPESSKMTLRIRCKRKVHKFKVNETDPFSKVISLLGEELGVSGDNKLLLSHKTTTITPSDSPVSLGLTTADIIDAVVMAKSVSPPPPTGPSESQLSSSVGRTRESIIIKVQTSDKHVMYNIAKDTPLKKAMTAFAAELKLPVSRLKFSFDGDIISPSQTAEDLEMENDDCIDVFDVLKATTTLYPDPLEDSSMHVPEAECTSSSVGRDHISQFSRDHPIQQSTGKMPSTATPLATGSTRDAAKSRTSQKKLNCSAKPSQQSVPPTSMPLVTGSSVGKSVSKGNGDYFSMVLSKFGKSPPPTSAPDAPVKNSALTSSQQSYFGQVLAQCGSQSKQPVPSTSLSLGTDSSVKNSSSHHQKVVSKHESQVEPRPQLKPPMDVSQVGHAQIVLGSSYRRICSSAKITRFRKSLKKDFSVDVVCSYEKTAVGSACLRVGTSHAVLLHVVVGSFNAEKVDVVVVPTDRATGNTGRYPVAIPSLSNSASQYLFNAQVLREIGDVVRVDGHFLACSSDIIQTLLPLSEQASSASLVTAFKNSLSLASKMHLGSVAFPGIKTEMIKCLVDSLSSMGPTTLHTVHIVLNTRAEANKFAKTLSDLVSRSLEEETLPGQSSTSISTPSASELAWSWRDDDGLFKPYSQASIDELNRAYRIDPNMPCVLEINSTRYVVHFKLMEQCNLKTGNRRDVVHHLTRGVMWQYLDDTGGFTPYTHSDSVRIEAIFQGNAPSQHLVIQNRRYGFNFTKMKQVNVETGHEREISREVLGEVRNKGSDVGVTRQRPEFLTRDEVVVNLKGHPESIETAKARLKEKLKSLLFSKTISYPPQATPALLLKLKEASRKHSVLCTVVSSNESGASNVSECVKLEGLEPSVVKARTEIQELIINFQLSLDQLSKTAEEVPTYPPEWDSMSKMEQVKIVNLKPDSAEYSRIFAKFSDTLPDQFILRIQRVQNKWLWDRYMQTKCRMHKKNAGTINEKELFHGTRDKPAKVICTSEEGFDMRFSRAGMWGQANYFAVYASYSDSYAYGDVDNQTNEMIVAKVLTGDSYFCQPNSSLRMPPEKKNKVKKEDDQIQQVRYDSVSGFTNGSHVFMTYNNDRAYPAYIITYMQTPSEPVIGHVPVPTPHPHPPQASVRTPHPHPPQASVRTPHPHPPQTSIFDMCVVS